MPTRYVHRRSARNAPGRLLAIDDDLRLAGGRPGGPRVRGTLVDVIVAFGSYRVDLARATIHHDSDPVELSEPEFRILAHLLAHPNQFVGFDELSTTVGSDSIAHTADELTVERSVATLREVLATRLDHLDDHDDDHDDDHLDDGERADEQMTDDGGDHEPADALIELVPGSGCRFVAEVAWRLPFAGRAQIVRDVVAVLDRDGTVAPDTHHGVAIFGPPRSGRTRLLTEIERALRRRRVRTVFVQGSTAPDVVPLQSVEQLLGQYRDLAAELRRSASGGDRAATDDARASVLRRAVISARARLDAGPTVVLVDDADDLDDASEAVLVSLSASGHISLVGAWRTGPEAPAASPEMLAGGRLHRIDLGPLTPDEVEALLHSRLAGPLPRQVVDHVIEETGAVAGDLIDFVERSLRANSLVEVDGTWRFAGPTDT